MSRHDRRSTDESTTSNKRDPRQIILPHVDTSYEIYKGRTFNQLLPFVPGGLLLVAAALLLMVGAVQPALIVLVVSLPFWAVAVHLDYQSTKAWYLTPSHIVSTYCSWARLRQTFPWSHERIARDTHGARRVRVDMTAAETGVSISGHTTAHGLNDNENVRSHAEQAAEQGAGYVERTDDTFAALVAVSGRNTARLPASTERRLTRSLTDGIDEDIKDGWWAFYSTTRRASAAEMADHREERADDMNNDLTPSQRDLLRESAEWLRERDRTHTANDWQHFIVIEATLNDIGVPAGSLADTAGSIRHRLKDFVGPKHYGVGDGRGGEDGDNEGDSDDTESDGERMDTAHFERQMKDVLDERATEVKSAIAGIEGVDAERAPATKHLEVLRAFWTDDPTATDEPDGDDPLFIDATRTADESGLTPTQRILAGEGYRPTERGIEFGGSYARTFWISRWPIKPDALFLSRLYDIGGVDLDVKLQCEPIAKPTAKQALEERARDIDAKKTKEAKRSPIDELSIKDEHRAYLEAYNELDGSNAQAWKLNGYVTVRANSTQKLRRYGKKVRRILEAKPAGSYPVAARTNQHELFQSNSPFSRDVYNDACRDDRNHITLAGGPGSAFPFGSESIREPGGILWGRNTQTGEPIIADPHERGLSPHMATIGWSRAGKTTFVKEACAGWFLDAPDDEPPRTLIVVDTQSEFADLARTCDGEHWIIGGQQPMNPFTIAPVSDDEIDADGNIIGDPLAAKVTELTQMFASMMQSGNRNERGETTVDVPYQLLDRVIERTYRQAGFEHNDPESFENDAPAPEAFIDNVGYVREHPEEFTFHGTEGEIEDRIDEADTILSNLIGFQEDGKYEHLRGEEDFGLLDEDVRMAYLDCRQFKDSDSAEESVGLQQAWSQVSQKIRQAPGKSIVVIDEAHVMYQSSKMIDWLEDAAREWARHDACLWSVSQSPEEFVRKQNTAGSGEENKRRIILEQCSTVQVFRCADQTSADALDAFGLRPTQIEAAKEELTPGRAGKGYSECLIQFADRHGWVESEIATVPMETDAAASSETESPETPESPTVDAQTTEIPAAADGGVTTGANVTDLTGIGDTYASRLRPVGIQTTEDLLNADPSAVADLADAPQTRVDGWFEQARETAVDGEETETQ